MNYLSDYRHIVGDRVVSEIYQKARKIHGKRVLHINSTYMGGGVAEILNSLVPLMNDVGLYADWRIIRGTTDLFEITKKFHNALQGDKINLTDIKKKLYLQASEDFSHYAYINHDCVIIHDPQPLPLIQYYKKKQPWIWRCHVDLSNPNPELWDFLKGFILRYDQVVISNEKYRKEDLPMTQRVLYPVIDPLSPKNKELSEKDIIKYLKKFKVPTDKPLITQISRFDKWKDPEGVVDVFLQVKRAVDCRLVLCGSMAKDDPEGIKIFEKVQKKSNKHLNNGDIILITSENNILVNALQRRSDIIVQKSIKEGFGLTVSEALWKGTPVVASDVGGIPLQVTDGGGYLVAPTDNQGFADRIVELLKNKSLAREMGQKGREHVKNNFLITKILYHYLDILAELMG